MTKSLTLCAIAIALALSSAVEADAAAYVPSHDDSSLFGVSREAAQPRDAVVAGGPGWCYWHPYFCDDED